MKTHHCSDAHSCDLSKAVQKRVIHIYNLGQMQCLRKKSIPVAPLTHDVTPASELRILRVYKKTLKFRLIFSVCE